MEFYEHWKTLAKAEVESRLENYDRTNRTPHDMWVVKHYIITDFLRREGCTPGFIEAIADEIMTEINNDN